MKPTITITHDIGQGEGHNHIGVIGNTEELVAEVDGKHFMMGLDTCDVCGGKISGRRWESFSAVFHPDCVIITDEETGDV